MSHYRIVAIASTTAEAVRRTLESPGYGHPGFVEIANGYGPCRVCLRRFDEGAERRIGFTYDAFSDIEDQPLPGPVFIHEDACERHPEADGFPEDLRQIPMTLDGYALTRRLVAREHVTNGTTEPVIERLLENPDIDYVQVHNREVGCFLFRIERRSPRPGA